MSLELELAKEACMELWNQYHEKIEELGYTMGKDSIIQDSEGISLVASISPPRYPPEMAEVFRKIIPMEFTYPEKTYPVIVSPSINALFGV